jgi:hypothetical protein
MLWRVKPTFTVIDICRQDTVDRPEERDDIYSGELDTETSREAGHRKRYSKIQLDPG